ncbi:MAG: hypothetical protein EOP53_09905 [Sphingobacteriales bacterium]|nr:MAG: hypothetical protein EOP53_09905 [Sphingobacteriales bacterium]
MRKLKRFSLALVLMFAVLGNLQAQNYSDLLRYSQKNYQGTARTAATGNAFGAIGADFGAISINPAGLGLFRRPDFTVGFSLNQQSATANYLGKSGHDDKYNLNMSNLGLVLADVRYKLGKPVQEGWVSVNFAIGFTRTNNFHGNVAIVGNNEKNSIVQSWTEEAQGKTYESLNQFSYPYLGSVAGLIQTVDPAGVGTEWEDVISREDPSTFKLAQEDYIGTRGAMNDINFAFAGNYSNKIYIGANITVPTIGYHSVREFTETNLAGSNIKVYNGLKLTEEVNTSGAGITAGFGTIFKPNEAIRLGLALQLPTFYSLYDSYETKLTSSRTDQSYAAQSPFGTYDYSIVTPMHATFSGAVLFGKNGFLSADYEYIDYPSARINKASDNSRAQNERIREIYKANGNLRIGGEYRYENMAFRAGYEMHGSPFKSEFVPDKFNGQANVISGGIGFRDADYYLDLTYQHQQTKSFYLPYALSSQQVEGANITNNRNNFMITVGSKF